MKLQWLRGKALFHKVMIGILCKVRQTLCRLIVRGQINFTVITNPAINRLGTCFVFLVHNLIAGAVVLI